MSDPLSLAVLSLFQGSTRTTAQCPGNFSVGGTQRCRSGPLGFNFGNINVGGRQRNTAGVGRSGSDG